MVIHMVNLDIIITQPSIILIQLDVLGVSLLNIKMDQKE